MTDSMIHDDGDAPTFDIFVTVGTDHHPFDRLIDYIEAFVAKKKAEGIEVSAFFQNGTSREPTSSQFSDYLTQTEMSRLMSTARVVVSHGGPATIADSRTNGRVPVVAPRDPNHGEHVDSHQQRFSAFLAEQGQIDLATDRDSLFKLLDGHLNGEHDSIATDPSADLDATVARFSDLVDRAVYLGERPHRRRLSSRFRRRQRTGNHAEQYRVLFATSGGGHLAQCWRLQQWFERHERSWVSFDMTSVASLLSDEKWTKAYHPTTRNIPNLLRNMWLANRVLWRERPDVIVSTGAGVAVPFFWLSRLYGAVTVYIEVYDRIDLATMTARLVNPTTDLMLLQWPDQEALYRRGTVIGPLL